MTSFFRPPAKKEFPPLNSQDEDYLRSQYMAPKPQKEVQPDARAIRIGEVEAVFGNRFKASEAEDNIQAMGFLKRRETQPFDTHEDTWAERQSPINFLLISGLTLLVGVGGWFTYKWLSTAGNQPPPFIAGDTTPYRIKPENPGGMVIPHQDKFIYNRIGPEQQQTVEHLLPEPEEPIDFMPTSPTPPPYVYDALPQESGVPHPSYGPEHGIPSSHPYVNSPYVPQGSPASHDHYGPTQLPVQPVPPSPQEAASLNSSPAQASHGTLPPSNLAHPNTQAHPTTAPYYSQQSEPIPSTPVAPAQPLTKALPSHSQNEFSAGKLPRQEERKNPQEPPFPIPAYAEPKAPVQESIETSSQENSPLEDLIDQSLSVQVAPRKSQGNFRVQIATCRSTTEAEQEIQRLRGIDPSLFKSQRFIIQKYSKDGKILYRVMVGFFEDAKSAAHFKNKLKLHRLSGLVVKG